MSGFDAHVTKALQSGRIRLWKPPLPGPKRRVLMIEKDLFAKVDDIRNTWLGQLNGDFESFCSDAVITVGYGRSSSCFLKLLHRADEEIWELRCKGINPQIRVFGRFIQKDSLFLTHHDARTGLDFDDNKDMCRNIWQDVFGAVKPLTGASFSDYLSGDLFETTSRPHPRTDSGRRSRVSAQPHAQSSTPKRP